MKQHKEVKISYFAAHLTTIVSVTLVLLIIGTIALVSLGAAGESRRLREKIELSVVMADTVGNDRAAQVCDIVATQPYARGARLITREEALHIWTEETGEDLEETFGVNPLSPEITFSVAADYASPAKLKAISAGLMKLSGVEAVAAPDASMVEAMHRNIERLTLILGGIALVMIVISFVLINNTVHLSIHSRRFTIHTMQLVGATHGFIRRPFVGNAMISGLIAGLIASGILAAVYFSAPELGLEDAVAAIPREALALTAAMLVCIGALICALAASIATTRYLLKDYDQLFR
ncbi:MAG: permease-like cell division protein FtsX [Muribaculaceae bacterium]|nr:permease-like cell division protein FtsX [Muribaculaceae bacterium]